MSIEAGGAFFCNDEDLTGDMEHMWVILSDPALHPECVVIVNLSSISDNRRYDPACTLKAGDHWFVKHPTFVYYRGAIPLTWKQLDDANIRHTSSLDSRVLERIRDGASKTRLLTHQIKQHLIDQGIIPS